ncbi:MAG: major capsid protein [Desulfobulbus sp.]
MNKAMTFSIWTALVAVAVLLYPAGAVFAADLSIKDFSGLALPLIGIGGVVDIFDTRTMLEAVEQMKRPGRFLRDTFFPGFRQFDTEAVDVDIVKGKRRLAPYVSPLAEGKVVERIGFATNTIKPGYIKPKIPTSAGDLLKRQPGEVLYQGGLGIEGRAQQQLGKDLAELLDMIDRREEWNAAQALNAGAVTMTVIGESGDQAVSVDFQMAAAHKITLSGTDLWSDSGSDPIADLAEWARLIRKDSGINPTDVVMGGDACVAFLGNATVQKFMDMRKVDLGMINPQQLEDGVTYVGTLKAPSLQIDVWTYDEWYIDESTGTETNMVPANKVWLGSRRAQNSKLYAVIQDMEAIEGGIAAAVQRFPKSWVTKDPSVRWLMIQSAPLMALNQPDAFVSAQVLS